MAILDLLKKNKEDQVSSLKSFSDRFKRKPKSVEDILNSIPGGIQQSRATDFDTPLFSNSSPTRQAPPVSAPPSPVQRSTPSPTPKPTETAGANIFTTPSGVRVDATTGKPIDGNIEDVIKDKTKSARDLLIERLTGAFDTAEAFNPVSRFKELREEIGVEQARSDVESTRATIAKTNELLDSLESDIKERTGEFIVSEPQRRRLLASESAPLLKGLSAAERTLATQQDILTARESDVITQLGLEELAANRPLQNILKQVQATGEVEELFRNKEEKIDTFVDEDGNRNVVFRDPETGETRNVIVGKDGDAETQRRIDELTIREKEIDIRNKIAGGFGSGQLTEDQVKLALDIGSKITADPVFKDMTDIQTGAIGVFQGLGQDNGFGDIAAINAFQRMIDPGATVRAEDVALLQEANSFIEQLNPEFQISRLRKGDKLPEPTRERMRELTAELYEARRQNYQELSGNKFENVAGAAGIPFEFVGAEFRSIDEILGGGQSTRSLGDEEAEAVIDEIIQSSGGGNKFNFRNSGQQSTSDDLNTPLFPGRFVTFN